MHPNKIARNQDHFMGPTFQRYSGRVVTPEQRRVIMLAGRGANERDYLSNNCGPVVWAKREIEGFENEFWDDLASKGSPVLPEVKFTLEEVRMIAQSDD